jgi:DNA-directed RNA polymerase specialized sigma subunit
MKAKDFLKQPEKLDAIINNKLIEKSQIKDIALGITAQMGGERVQSSGSQQRMADAVDRCIDMENEINRLIDRLIAVKQDVTGVIEQLNVAEYKLLHLLYIQGKTFDEIAEIMLRSKSWVATVHGRALANVQHILNERESNNG